MATAHEQIRLRRMSDAELETVIIATGLITIGGDWPALRQRHFETTGGGTSCYTAAIGDNYSDPLYSLRINHPENAALFEEATRRWPERRMLFIDWATKAGVDCYLEPAFTKRVAIRIGDFLFDALVAPDTSRHLREETEARHAEWAKFDGEILEHRLALTARNASW